MNRVTNVQEETNSLSHFPSHLKVGGIGRRYYMFTHLKKKLRSVKFESFTEATKLLKNWLICAGMQTLTDRRWGTTHADRLINNLIKREITAARENSLHHHQMTSHNSFWLTSLTYEIVHLFPGDRQMEREKQKGREIAIKRNTLRGC